MKHLFSLTLTLAALLPTTAASIYIPATSDIYAAGGNRALAVGATSPVIALPHGQDRVFNISNIIGSVTWGTGVTDVNPDSVANPFPGVFTAVNRLSGLTSPQWFPLYGVFLGDELPATAPAALNFKDPALGISFPDLAPELGQIFFLGDGKTGTGSGDIQDFLIPEGATRLFLGFNDDLWTDNRGGYTIDYAVIPEPSTLGILLCGVALATRRYRRGSHGESAAL